MLEEDPYYGDARYEFSGDQRDETVTVGVIGAGRRMTPLLSRMLEYDYVDVRMVVDASPTAPGILIAQSLGVETSGKVEDLFAILGEIDFLFCVNDDADLRDLVINEFRRTNNRRTIFLNELASRFITSLTKDARHLMQLVPPPTRGGMNGEEN
ncbi:MAG: hypothetical protein ACYC5Q_10220 [Thermoleophilia bacterium]